MKFRNKSIRNIEKLKPVKRSQVNVLVCPPLTKRRFKIDRQRAKLWLFDYLRRRKEFIKLNLNLYSTWEIYEDKIALPVLMQLLDVKENLKANVFIDVTFRDFKRLYLKSNNEIFFLVAHHISRKGNKNGLIEFADGGHSIVEFKEFLEQTTEVDSPSLILLICNIGEITETLHEKIVELESFGAAYGMYPFIKGIQFLNWWVKYLDGVNDLMEGYEKAIEQFIRT